MQAADVQYIISIGDCTYTFYPEILAPLEGI